MTWEDIIKVRGTAGRKNPFDFKEYGQATPMKIPEKERREKRLAELKEGKKPLTEQEEMAREVRLKVRRAKKEAKKAREAMSHKTKPRKKPTEERDEPRRHPNPFKGERGSFGGKR